MKKLILAIGLFFSTLTFAQTPAENLNARLSKISDFTASFTQKVISPEQEVLTEGKGNIWLSRPNLFRWHTLTPDENLLVSDGKTLWYYNPFVEQVTITWLEDTTNQTPFVLIARNNVKDWDKYEVVQKKNYFSLTAKDKSKNIPVLTIEVTEDGMIKSLSLLEQDGQKSTFTLSNFKKERPDEKMFKLDLPEGVEIDDQRAH